MNLTLNDLKIIAESFQAFCIGIGAIIAGIAGFAGISDWWERQAANDRLKKVKEKYPESLMGKKLLVGYTKSSEGTWYLIDKRSRTSHHIQNIGTLRALDWGHFRQTLEENFQKKFPIRESIYTTPD